MTHLQKKCLIGSVCLHSLAAAVVLATAAFRSAPTIMEEQVLTLIPATVLDRPGVGGEPPPAAVKPQPTQPTSVPTLPRPQNQPPQPAPPKPQPQPAPASPPRNVAATPPRQPDTRSSAPRTAAPPAPARSNGIKVDLTQTAPATRAPSRNTDPAAAAQEASNKRMMQQEMAAALAELGSSVQSRTSLVSVASLPGEGGGEAFVNYRTAVFNAYYQAWKTPEGTIRRLAVADVKIVVGRDGAILSSEFVSKSGDAAVDQSIQRALDQVERQKLPPFPAGAVDTQRPFIIRFNLEAKQSAG